MTDEAGGMVDRVLEGVLFDVGYVLLDESRRLDAAIGWLRHRLAGLGLHLTPEALREAYRGACCGPDPSVPSLIVQQLVRVGVSRQAAEALRAELVWDAVPLEPYPDALAALRRLRDGGLRVGVLANQPASAAADLERCGIAALCDGIWLSEAVGLSKPDPAFFRLALDGWQLPAERVAYVGDRPDNDVGPARALGFWTVRLRQGPHAGQPVASGAEVADRDVASLDEASSALLGPVAAG